MRFKHLLALGAGLLAVLYSDQLRAQTTNRLTFASTMRLPGPIYPAGEFTVYQGPGQRALDTGLLLRFLAVDEHAAGRYAATNFPGGARLAAVGRDHTHFQVVDSHGNPLVSVTNIMHWVADTNRIAAGRLATASGVAAPNFTEFYNLQLVFDDTAIPGSAGLRFFLGGLAIRTVTDTAPNRSGYYVEQVSEVISDGMGAGNYQGTPFTLQGNFSLQGKGQFQLGGF